jgi:hypothetical protein
MTKEEMNNYLQSIGGLINGHNTEMPLIINSNFFQCNEGWYPLLKELIDTLITAGWNKETCQVKEKFGGLRFYINNCSDTMYDIIHEAEDKSYTICEITGKPGVLRTDIGWYLTLCDEEYIKIKTKKQLQ